MISEIVPCKYMELGRGRFIAFLRSFSGYGYNFCGLTFVSVVFIAYPRPLWQIPISRRRLRANKFLAHFSNYFVHWNSSCERVRNAQDRSHLFECNQNCLSHPRTSSPETKIHFPKKVFILKYSFQNDGPWHSDNKDDNFFTQFRQKAFKTRTNG